MELLSQRDSVHIFSGDLIFSTIKSFIHVLSGCPNFLPKYSFCTVLIESSKMFNINLPGSTGITSC